METENYQQLIQKLDHFIRRYYLNRLIRGCLLFLTGVSAIWLALGVGEYFLYLPAWVKIGLLSLISLLILIVLISWIIRPALAMQQIGKTLTREQAAIIVGQFFPEIKDKLLNILQLHSRQHTGESIELALAAIEQKSTQLTLLPIRNAVNLKENKRYLKWLFPVLAAILLITIVWPKVFEESAFRLGRPTQNFYPPAPFQFILQNKTLQLPLDGNYIIQLKVTGKKLPAEVSVIINGQNLVMQSNGSESFSYTLNNVKKNTAFYFQAAGFRSEDFELKILERPQVEGLVLKIDYPPYTGLKNEVQQGFSNISVPEGTKLQWQLTTKNTDSAIVKYIGGKQLFFLKNKQDNQWNYNMDVMQDTSIQIYLSNKKLPRFDTLSYTLKAIPDEAPQINAQEDKDTISGRKVLITGIASDDYGLSKLLFHYTIVNPNHKVETDKTIPIQATANARSLNFSYYFDINTFNLTAGQTLNYFVEAWDNDAIHGPKRSISQIFSYRQKNNMQLEKSIQANNLAINEQLSNSSNSAENINQDIDKFRNGMLQSQGMSWEQQNQLKSLTAQQKELQNKVAALKRRFEEQKRQSQEKNYSQNIQEKQQELTQQLDKVQNKDLADLMKKLQQMLQEKNKDNTFQELQQWQEQNKLFQMDMERIQALMKQLALQMKMEDLAQKAQQLAKAQEDLAQKTTSQGEKSASLNQAQKGLKQQLDEMMQKDFSDLEKMNQSGESPHDLSSPKQAGNQAQQQMQQSENSLNQNNFNQSGSQQQNAANDLNKMASALSKMASGMDMKMVDINIKATRQLLTNLIRYSFDQEALFKSERVVPANVATYEKQLQKQHILKANTEMIKDSLFSLSKRIFSLAPTINKETSELTGNLDKALSLLENHRILEARISQQYAMTNANNLALMLDETLRHLMQMQMQGQKGGQGSPSSGKPGAKGQGSSPGQMMKDVITGQQQMGKGMSEMQGASGGQQGSGKQSGGQQGNNKQNGGNGEQQAEELARLAEKQAALRNMMQELSSMLNSQGNGQNARLIQEIQKEMNQNEVDLVNRRLTSELMKRQQEIMTRLLQAQDAIRNQEQENKRVAETAKDIHQAMPPELKLILEKRKAFLESYQTIPASLAPFYKKMSEDYQKQINGK